MKKLLWSLGLAAALALSVMLWIVLSDRSVAELELPESSAEITESLPTFSRQELEIRLLGGSELTLECGADFADPGAEAWLIEADGTRVPLEIQVSPVPDTAKPGTQEIVYSAVRGGETLGSVSRSVIVLDTSAPVITLLGEPGERDYTASDDVDGDLTDRVQRTEEADRFVYTVSDSAGNEARAERLKAPVLRFAEGEHNTQIPADYCVRDPWLIAQDMYGRDLTDRVEITGVDTPWRPGTYQATYRLTDDFGRSVSVERTVEIVPAELPETVRQEKVIYLTFDDGPAEETEALLDMLAKYDAKVTFFVTNTDPRYVDMIGRAAREGHSIGVHGYVHDASKLYASEEAYFDYFDKLEELIYEQTGEYTRIVRFIGGSSNTASMNICPGIMTKLAEDLTVMGYRYYDWNIEPETWAQDVTEAARNITGNVYAMNEEGVTVPISLQHDTGGWARFIAEIVIQWGLEHGYTFKGIDLTTPEIHHMIRN